METIKDEPSWSLPPLYDNARDKRLRYALEKISKEILIRKHQPKVINDDYYVDGRCATTQLGLLKNLQTLEKTFF